MALAITKPATYLPRPKPRTPLVETLRTNGHSNGRTSVTPSLVRQFVQAQVTDLVTAVESAGTQGLSILQKMQIALGFKPAADLRAQQMAAMATEAVEPSPAEKWSTAILRRPRSCWVRQR